MLAQRPYETLLRPWTTSVVAIYARKALIAMLRLLMHGPATSMDVVDGH
jgi:hypothetical protein